MKLRFTAYCLCLGSLLPGVVLADAVITGQVALPKRRARAVITQRYEIVAKAGVLSVSPPLAVVYLEGSFSGPSTRPTVQVAQKDLAFQPTLLAIQTGTRVEFPNRDDVYHNIFSYSAPKRFDLGRYRADEKPVPSQVFDVAGLVTLRCDIHEHMRALILVVDTPHFVVTDEDGRFQLKGIPPGNYVVKAWLDSQTVRAQPVKVTDEAELRVDFK